MAIQKHIGQFTPTKKKKKTKTKTKDNKKQWLVPGAIQGYHNHYDLYIHLLPSFGDFHESALFYHFVDIVVTIFLYAEILYLA